MNIWQSLPPHFTILAPMEGVTDAVFRQVVARAARPDLFFTEFTNVSSFASEQGRHSALERLAIVPTDPPIVAQLWGKTPEHFAYATAHLPTGFAGIDINMGCPDKNVVRSGGGSALAKPENRELSAALIASARDNTTLPISVKTRLGYSRVDEWQDWLTHLLRQDIAALTIHLRTKKEMSKVPAHYELIPEIIELRNQLAPQTTLIFNGDFLSRSHFDHILTEQGITDSERYGCMIGRGIFQNPFCFEHNPRPHSREELIALLHYHLDLFDKHHADNAKPPFEPLKRFFKIYISNFPGSHTLRTELMETHTTTEVRTILHNS